MNKGWLKKISLALMLAISLGTVACGGGQDFEDEAEFENFEEGGNTGNSGGSVECFGNSGCITSGDGFTSVSTSDGNTFVSEF